MSYITPGSSKPVTAQVGEVEVKIPRGPTLRLEGALDRSRGAVTLIRPDVGSYDEIQGICTINGTEVRNWARDQNNKTFYVRAFPVTKSITMARSQLQTRLQSKLNVA